MKNLVILLLISSFATGQTGLPEPGFPGFWEAKLDEAIGAGSGGMANDIRTLWNSVNKTGLLQSMNVKDARTLMETILALAVSNKKTLKNLGEYKDLDDCMNTSIYMHQPMIPTFCESSETRIASISSPGSVPDCAECFGEARKTFNKIRLLLAKNKGVYDCTMTYLKNAIAFGKDWYDRFGYIYHEFMVLKYSL